MRYYEDRFTFNAERHEYRYHGRIVPGVSDILEPLYREAFAHADPLALAEGAWRGSAIHEMIAAAETVGAGVTSREVFRIATDRLIAVVQPELQGYLRAYQRFRLDVGLEELAMERPIYNPNLGYGGTPDLIGTFLAMPEDVIVLDWKTSVALSPITGVQLSGYKLAWNVNLEASEKSRRIRQRWGVRLGDNGTYHLQSFTDPDDDRCFEALVNVRRAELTHHPDGQPGNALNTSYDSIESWKRNHRL